MWGVSESVEIYLIVFVHSEYEPCQSAYDSANPFIHQCLKHISAACLTVCFWLISGSCMYLKLKTRYSLKVKLLIWTQRLFLNLLLFLLLQSSSCSFNFKHSGWGEFLAQHTLSTHTYIPFSSTSCILMPFQASFHSAKNSVKFKFTLLEWWGSNLSCWGKAHESHNDILMSL